VLASGAERLLLPFAEALLLPGAWRDPPHHPLCPAGLVQLALRVQGVTPVVRSCVVGGAHMRTAMSAFAEHGTALQTSNHIRGMFFYQHPAQMF
jgi:hypothetical protein